MGSAAAGGHVSWPVGSRPRPLLVLRGRCLFIPVVARSKRDAGRTACRVHSFRVQPVLLLFQGFLRRRY
jgi:hypothetical protein